MFFSEVMLCSLKSINNKLKKQVYIFKLFKILILQDLKKSLKS